MMYLLFSMITNLKKKLKAFEKEMITKLCHKAMDYHTPILTENGTFCGACRGATTWPCQPFDNADNLLAKIKNES